MKIIPLPLRTFKNGEEHFPINYYFEEDCEYEIAILDITHLKRVNRIIRISTNILEYDIFNPEQIIYTLGPITSARVSSLNYYKIRVSSLHNFRLKFSNIPQQPFAITLGIRKSNGKAEI